MSWAPVTRGRKKRTAEDVLAAREVALRRIKGEQVPTPKVGGLEKRPATQSPWRGQRAAMGKWKGQP